MGRKVDNKAVLDYIQMRGLTLRKAAEEMGVSYKTLITYRQRGTVSRFAAMSFAIAEGLPADFFFTPRDVAENCDTEGQRL